MKAAPLLALIVPVLLPHAAGATELTLHGDSVVRFATRQEAVAALSVRDRFIAAMSPFDRQARLMAGTTISEEAFLKFAAEQVLDWQEGQVKKLSDVLVAVREKLDRLKLAFPQTVLIVQTTGKEEGSAAYCRGNAVVLPRNVVGKDKRHLEELITHELFHILSRNNPDLRRSLYAIIGFKPCGEVRLPETLRHRKITNPDAPTCEYYIELTVDDRPVKAVPVLFASVEKYDEQRGGTFFRYLRFRLMVVHERKGVWQAVERDGRLLLLQDKDVPSYHDQIGRNTKYIIHPEEILADNFVALVHQTPDLPSPRIVAEMQSRLAK